MYLAFVIFKRGRVDVANKPQNDIIEHQLNRVMGARLKNWIILNAFHFPLF